MDEIHTFRRLAAALHAPFEIRHALEIGDAGALSQGAGGIWRRAASAEEIAKIKCDEAIVNFDLVALPRAGDCEATILNAICGAKIVMIDVAQETALRRFADDANYRRIDIGGDAAARVVLFHRVDVAPPRLAPRLPIHFFTLVLNGEPFIRYHEQMLAELPVEWRWHIVEGVARLAHDTAWSVAAGGRIDEAIHRDGRSIDGTSEYLDDLVRRYPDNVVVYRKPAGEFWDGKREMCNAPLANIQEEALLWQIDADELWTARQIIAMHRLFVEQPKKTAAVFWCDYFVGPTKIVSTRYNYAQNPQQEWRRLWRYKPGDRWAAHEPPMLARPRRLIAKPIPDLATHDAFSPDDCAAAGAVFQHFAYATPQQLAFKESYYGYKGALAQWEALQRAAGAGLLRDYFQWVSDETLFDDAARHAIAPLARLDGDVWRFDAAQALAKKQTPLIVVDGVFFQYHKTGIARVWTNLLGEWIASGFGEHVVLLDRAGTAPRFPGLHSFPIPPHDYAQTGADALMLEEVCARLGADVFVSTYYTTPTRTPSLFFGHDMIPEILGLDLEQGPWCEKRRAIAHASAHVMVSQNSARDLERLAPHVAQGATIVVHNGVDPSFTPASDAELDAFRARFDLDRDWVILPGERIGAGGYKNAELVVRALAARPERFILLTCGGTRGQEPQLRALAPMLDMRHEEFSDADLRAAYSGAFACVYPSRYEGFGLPVLEAMACGAPVIACANSSIPEVGGDAAIYTSDSDACELLAHLDALEDAATRADYRARGLARAAQFSFAESARKTERALRETVAALLSGAAPRPGEGWREMRLLERAAQNPLCAQKRASPLTRLFAR
jgi:glycosyltransferase involved in cell wall biosynthesis